MFHHILALKFEPSPAANNPEEFLLYNVRNVQWREIQHIRLRKAYSDSTHKKDRIIKACFKYFKTALIELCCYLFMVLQKVDLKGSIYYASLAFILILSTVWLHFICSSKICIPQQIQ